MRKLSIIVSLLGSLLLMSCDDPASVPMDVYDISPRGGSISGEQPVRVTGVGFRSDVGYSIYFGPERAPNVTILDATTLLVTSPPHAAGRVDVVIAADDGPAFRIVNGFEFADQSGNVHERMGEGGSSAGRF